MREIFHGNAEYLEDSGCEFKVKGCQVAVWGSPTSRGHSNNAAFQSQTDERLSAIPKDIDILVVGADAAHKKKEARKLGVTTITEKAFIASCKK